MTYALDTNVIIHLLNQNKSVEAKRDEAVAKNERFIIPPVVDYELRRGFLYKPSPKKAPMYFALASHYGIGDMTSQAWFRAADIYASLRRKSLTVADADILIAAFCIVNDYTLITNNTGDFKDIDALTIEDWIIQ